MRHAVFYGIPAYAANCKAPLPTQHQYAVTSASSPLAEETLGHETAQRLVY